LFAAGSFISSSYPYKACVAKWNGTTWSELGGSLYVTDFIYSLCLDNADNLYTAGNFPSFNDTQVGKCNSSSWDLIPKSNGYSFDGPIISMILDPSGNIYIGDDFKNSSRKYFVAKYTK
jgi:hypothetical protein